MRKRKINRLIPALLIVCIAALAVMIFALTRGITEPSAFSPPPFESAAQSGTPEVTNTSWTKIYQDGMSFSAHVCGEATFKEGSADLFFTNDAENNVWLKLRITDENGNVLGETGLLKPNEYVKSVALNTIPAVGTKIRLKMMAYEPETYYSAGSVSVNITVGG